MKHYRAIKVQFVPPTNEKSFGIKFFEDGRFAEDRRESKVVYFNSEISDVLKTAFAILKVSGFNPECYADQNDYYTILCDCWGENYKSVKQIKS